VFLFTDTLESYYIVTLLLLYDSILRLICYIKDTDVRNIETGENALCGSDMETQSYNSSTWEVMAAGQQLLSTLETGKKNGGHN
jgi:hypothetical protein